MRSVWAIVFALSGVSAAFASGDSGLRTLITANDSKGWEAVGRLDIGPSGFCTGALVAPDIVLTAAHCMFDPTTRSRIPATEIEFLAGWRNGQATAYRSVRNAVIHPRYEYHGPQAGSHVAVDIALLQLDRPIRNGQVTPFETSRRPRKGAEVGVVSYARNRARRPALEEVCHVLGRPAGTLVMSCNVDYGSSGAPVFMIEDGVPKIVSVISAKAEINGMPVSLGTSLERDIPELRAALDAERGTKRTQAATRVRRFEGGGTSAAKFVRP